jgi:hypothetical protein
MKCNATPTTGCCWLKATEVSGKAPTVFDKHACSAWVRVPGAHSDGQEQREGSGYPKTKKGEAPAGGAGKKNVLYIVVDDLRPDLVAYGQNFTHNPSIAKLASTGLVFDNA